MSKGLTDTVLSVAIFLQLNVVMASTNEGTAVSSSLQSPIDCHTALVSESEKRSEAHSKTGLISEALSRAPQFFDYFDKASLQVMERDYVILPMQLAWLAKEHLLMIGAPGNAKTTLAKLTMGQVIDEKSKKPSFFARQMTAETTLTDTHGGLDFKVLNDTGRQRRLYDEGILGSHFGLFDEQFDMRPNGYRNILDVLAERSHSEGPNEHKGITWSVVGASNAMLPEVYAMFNGSEKPRALIDRYAFVLYIPPEMQKVKNQRAIVQASRHQKPALPRLTFQDIEALQKLVPLVEIPDHVADLLGLIHYRLRPLLESTEQSLVQEHNGKVANGEKPLPPFRSTKYQSPRTLDKAAGILKAFVVLEFLKSKGQRPLVASIDDLPVVELFYTLNAPSKDFIESQIKRAQKDVEKEQLRHLKMEREIAEKTIQSTVSEFRETIDHYALTDIHNQVQNYKSLSAYDRRHLMDGLREMYRESHQPEIEDLIDYEPQDVAKLSIVELIEQWVHDLVPNRSDQVIRHWLSDHSWDDKKRRGRYRPRDNSNDQSTSKEEDEAEKEMEYGQSLPRALGFAFLDAKALKMKSEIDKVRSLEKNRNEEIQVDRDRQFDEIQRLRAERENYLAAEIQREKSKPKSAKPTNASGVRIVSDFNSVGKHIIVDLASPQGGQGGISSLVNHSKVLFPTHQIEQRDGGVYFRTERGDLIYFHHTGHVGRVKREIIEDLLFPKGFQIHNVGPWLAGGWSPFVSELAPMGPYLRHHKTSKIYKLHLFSYPSSISEHSIKREPEEYGDWLARFDSSSHGGEFQTLDSSTNDSLYVQIGEALAEFTIKDVNTKVYVNEVFSSSNSLVELDHASENLPIRGILNNLGSNGVSYDQKTTSDGLIKFHLGVRDGAQDGRAFNNQYWIASSEANSALFQNFRQRLRPDEELKSNVINVDPSLSQSVPELWTVDQETQTVDSESNLVSFKLQKTYDWNMTQETDPVKLNKLKVLRVLNFGTDENDSIDRQSIKYWVDNGEFHYVAFANLQRSDRDLRLYYGHMDVSNLEDQPEIFQQPSVVVNLKEAWWQSPDRKTNHLFFHRPEAKLVRAFNPDSNYTPEMDRVHEVLYISDADNFANLVTMIDLHHLQEVQLPIKKWNAINDIDDEGSDYYLPSFDWYREQGTMVSAFEIKDQIDSKFVRAHDLSVDESQLHWPIENEMSLVAARDATHGSLMSVNIANPHVDAMTDHSQMTGLLPLKNRNDTILKQNRVSFHEGGVYFIDDLHNGYYYIHHDGRRGRVPNSVIAQMLSSDFTISEAMEYSQIFPMGPYLRSRTTKDIYKIHLYQSDSDMEKAQQTGSNESIVSPLHFLTGAFDTSDKKVATAYSNENLFLFVMDPGGKMVKVAVDKPNDLPNLLKETQLWPSLDLSESPFNWPYFQWDQKTGSDGKVTLYFIRKGEGDTGQHPKKLEIDLENQNFNWKPLTLAERDRSIEAYVPKIGADQDQGYKWDVKQVVPLELGFQFVPVSDSSASRYIQFARDPEDQIDFQTLQYWIDDGYLRFVALANFGTVGGGEPSPVLRHRKLYHGSYKLGDLLSHQNEIQKSQSIELNADVRDELFNKPVIKLVRDQTDQGFVEKVFISEERSEIKHVLIVDLNRLVRE